jgi:hypothetical protein
VAVEVSDLGTQSEYLAPQPVRLCARLISLLDEKGLPLLWAWVWLNPRAGDRPVHRDVPLHRHDALLFVFVSQIHAFVLLILRRGIPKE